MKRVALYTLGCKLNYTETATLGAEFKKQGYNIVPIDEETDIVVINSCSVTENADRECRQIIRKVQRTSPNAFIAVVGCYSQLQPSKISKIPGVHLVLGTTNKFDLFRFLEQTKKQKTQVEVSCIDDTETIHPAVTTEFGERTRVFLKIQDGCDYPCTYCTIPLARGKSRSVSETIIIDQAKNAVEKGYKEIVLTGVNIGEYSTPSCKSLLELLKLLVTIEQLKRIRISSIEPNLLSDELLEFWSSEPKLCKHWHIPLQSGSNEILKRMRRRYLRELYEKKIHTIKERLPNSSIGVDIIVGFPGETELYFEETYSFLDSLPVTYFHVFTYSPRPNTLAESFPDQVHPTIKAARSKILHTLGDSKKKQYLQSMKGRIVNVLFENETKPDIYTGLADEYIRVDVPFNRNLKNCILPVIITDVVDDYCIGSVLSTVQQYERNVA